MGPSAAGKKKEKELGTAGGIEKGAIT